MTNAAARSVAARTKDFFNNCTERNKVEIKTQKLKPLGVIPKPTTVGAAGADLVAIEGGYVEIGRTRLIRTGLAMAIPQGYAGLVCSRSGLALKNRIFVLNAPGIVDADYRGDVGVILFNAGNEPFEVKAGDRVAQLLIVKVEEATFVPSESLDETARGTGGFGSTGVGNAELENRGWESASA